MRHNARVGDRKAAISELANLMVEYGITEAKLESGDLKISFKVGELTEESLAALPRTRLVSAPEPAVEAVKGSPITSPMAGIYYGSASPGAPAFVREGDTVTAGQVIGLIEAMKVFNEIPAPISGTVLKIVAESGGLVQPGDTLILVG